MNQKVKAYQLKLQIPAVFLALKKKETPIISKILAGITIAYALSPIDLIPDFIPVLGYLDDILILPVLVALTIKLIPKDIFERCLEESADLWHDGKPKKWYYAVPVIIIWIVLLVLMIHLIFDLH